MGNKNLFCVPLIEYDVPDDKLTAYWSQVEAQITKLALNFGRVTKIFHEANYATGDEGLVHIERINEKGFPLIKNLVTGGAVIQPLEDKDLLLKIADCQLFFTLRFTTQEIVTIVSKSVPEISQIYQDAIQQRSKLLPGKITENLKEGETGLLIIGDSERLRIQFPTDIEIIIIRPPILTEIEQIQRDQQNNK
jgi:hypothetical protein